MRFRLTVVDPDAPAPPCDVLVTADEAAEVADVRREVLAAVGVDPAARLFLAGSPVDEHMLVGVPPLTDGAVLSTHRPGASPRDVDGTDGGLLELHVSGGPSAGAVHRLRPGRHRVGRAAGADVHVDDADLSRVHAVVEVAADGVTVTDLGSMNGTALDGADVDGAAVRLPVGARLTLGSSTLVVRLPEAAAAATRTVGDGTVGVNRAPRHDTLPTTREIRLPPAPTAPEGARVPLLGMVLPVLVAVPMAFLWSPVALLFALTTPVLVLGNLVSDRRSGRTRYRRDLEEHQRERRRCDDEVRGHLEAESRHRYLRHPDPAEVSVIARGPSVRLWERRRDDPDALELRLGIGSVPSQLVVVEPGSNAGRSPAEDVRSTPTLDDVPVTLPLAELGVVGVAGARHRTTSLVRALLGQLAVLHSPRDVHLVVLGATGREGHHDGELHWGWTRWLPHVRAAGLSDALLVGVTEPQVRRRVGELLSLVDVRAAEQTPTPDPRVVVLLDGAHALRDVPGVARLLSEGPARGVHLLCLDDRPARLPVECRATVTVAGEVGNRLRVSLAGQAAGWVATADLVGRGWAERVARSLAPLRDATPELDAGHVPERVRLLDALDVDAADPVAVAASWSVHRRSTRALLGLTAAGPYAPDLREDGPHVLVGGTTGSGKSELLQTLVASLAVANRPDEMQFVLVDYKGGAAFAECARLPHTAGLVTDLDGHLTARALESLGAELRRRERLLRASGARDIEDYQAALDAAAALEPLPRLVLVVDEFRVLAEELPDFLAGLVRLAAVGRSLGVHLVLATQRPGGVVSADIKANVNLRIALRVRDDVDSSDVVESRDAAAISPRLPGRALARTGSSPLVELQTARVGGRPDVVRSGEVSARRLTWERLGDDPGPAPRPAEVDGPTDLERLVDAVRGAATLVGVRPTKAPWLPPLPDHVASGDLCFAVEPTPTSLALGLVDLPAQQAQEPLRWDPATDGCLLVAGTGRTGRTGALLALAAAAARARRGGVHVYGIDGGSGGLTPAERLPCTGAVVGRDEPDRVARLLARLVAEVEGRRTRLAAAGHASMAEHRAAAGVDAPPYAVLLVDGWEAVARVLEDVDHGRPLEHLLQLVREGPAAGVLTVVTGDRGLLTSRVGSAVADKLLLRTADPTDAVLAGVSPQEIPLRMPPGRALHVTAAGVREVQVAAPLPGASWPETLAALGRATGAAGGPAPLRIRALPGHVAMRDLPPTLRGDLVVGVGGEDVVPVGLDLVTTPVAVVAGSAGSGRSTALLTVAQALSGRGRPVVALCPRPSPLAASSHAAQGSTTDSAALRGLLDRALADGTPAAVLVDDVETVDGTAVEGLLLDVVARAPATGEVVVVAGTAAEIGARFRGVAVEARRSRTGILLCPTGYADGDVLGVSVPRVTTVVPGRGVLVRRGDVVPVQVAVPDEEQR